MAKKNASSTVKATVEETVEKATTTAKAVAEKAEAKAKEVVEEVTEKVPAAKAVKETVTEKAPAAKAAAKKATAKAKKAVEKIVPVEETYFEINGEQIQMEKIVAAVKEAYKAEGHRLTSIKSLQTYVNAAEHKAYYVINGNAEGKFVEF